MIKRRIVLVLCVAAMVLFGSFAFRSSLFFASSSDQPSVGQFEFALYVDDYRVGLSSGWAHIMAYNWEENRTVYRNLGASAALPTLRDFRFQAGYSDFSPRLFVDCASGRHLRFAVLMVRQWIMSGEDLVLVQYLNWYFTDVIISRYETSGSTGGVSTGVIDEFGIVFGKIGVEYWPDLQVDLSIQAGYDLTQNKQYYGTFQRPPLPFLPPWWLLLPE